MTPVVVLGGAANAVSVARSRARRRGGSCLMRTWPVCTAFALLPADRCAGRRGRLGRFPAWPRRRDSARAVLLSCSDVGIELIAAHRDALAVRFLLDDFDPAAQLAMLDKLATYRSGG